MLFLFEGPLDDDRGDADRLGLARAASAQGHEVVSLPREVELNEADARTPPLPGAGPRCAALFGDTPSAARYQRVYDECLAQGARLLNSPAQHLDALEFDRIVHRLGALTAATRVVHSVDEVDAALAALGLPVFVKGSVGSRKFLGWKACVASTGDEAIELTGRLLRIPSQARGRVMLRALLPLRRTGVEYAGFPLAREYRLFVLDGEVLARGAYWATGDPFGPPTDADLAAFAALSRDVFERTTIPWLSVDVGQLDDGAWRVIETGDPACAGLSAIEPGPLIRSLGAAMRARPR